MGIVIKMTDIFGNRIDVESEAKENVLIKETFDISKVKIKDSLINSRPFDPHIRSNIAIATILSYVGRKAYVYALLQRLNHKGRAYCFNQDSQVYGLKAFLVIQPSTFSQLGRRARDVIRKIETKRLLGRLKAGSATFKIFQEEGTYSGEVNEKGKAYGEGQWTDGKGKTYTGYFKKDKVEAYCYAKLKYGMIDKTFIGEMQGSHWTNKRTHYTKNGDVINEVFYKEGKMTEK